jgi:hypothetical protein
LLTLARPILVLKHLNWPDSIEETFLAGWRNGRPALPVVELHVPDWSRAITALDDFVERCAGDDPIVQFLRRTAWSYAEAGRMLMAAGTPERSIHLYGRPDDVYATQSFTGVDAAAFLLEKTDHLLRGAYIAPAEAEQPAEAFAARLQAAVSAYFVDDQVKVVVDNELSSKAVAGSTRLRVRGSAVFSELDLDQLYHHEALIHMATAINGRRQRNLRSLGLGAPRTTRTQEGIAVFAELATRSIDISRLRRLALRTQVLKQALDGADFIDCSISRKTFITTTTVACSSVCHPSGPDRIATRFGPGSRTALSTRSPLIMRRGHGSKSLRRTTRLPRRGLV